MHKVSISKDWKDILKGNLANYYFKVHPFLQLPRWLVVKNPPANAGEKRCGFDPWVRKIPWRRAWQPTPVFLPGESHGQTRLVDSPWSRKESDTTETTYHACMHTHSLLEKYQSHREFPLRNANWKRIFFSSNLKVLNHFKIKHRHVVCNQELLVLVCHGSHEFDELELLYRQSVHSNMIVSKPQR